MSASSDRRIASLFGFLGTALLLVAGILDLLSGVFYFAVGHGGRAFGSFDQGLIFVVVGLIVGFFVATARMEGSDRTVVVGVVLLVLAILGWLALGFGSGVLALLATICILVSGVVFLVAGR
ncbi:MAG: hypothetical protein ACLQD9_09070 [Thermoplasmata archaeon]